MPGMQPNDLQMALLQLQHTCIMIANTACKFMPAIGNLLSPALPANNRSGQWSVITHKCAQRHTSAQKQLKNTLCRHPPSLSASQWILGCTCCLPRTAPCKCVFGSVVNQSHTRLHSHRQHTLPGQLLHLRPLTRM